MSRPPAGLSTRGRRLWREVTDSQQLGAAQVVLLEEACRLADRMDRMDAILRGEASEWMSVEAGGGELSVTVNPVLSEARQHATAYKQILAELRQGQKARPAKGATGGRGGVADLTQKIAERRSQSTG